MTEATSRPRPDVGTAAAALFALTVRQHTHGRRLLVLGLLYLLPCVLALVLRNLTKPAPSDGVEFALILTLLPHGLAPLTALLYAAGIISDEVEEQTLTYILVRSIPRWVVFATKLIASLAVTTLLVSVGVTALYLAIYAGTPEFVSDILPRVGRTIALTALAQVGYCALFGFIGLATRWPLVAGIAFIVAVEGVLANMNFVGRSFTVVYYVRTLSLRWLDLPKEQMSRCQEAWGMQDLAELPTAAACVGWVVGFAVVVTALTSIWFARSEYRVKTPGGE